MFTIKKALLPAAVVMAMPLAGCADNYLAEGAGAAAVATALAGRAGTGKIACVVSGGHIDLDELNQILSSPD